MNTPSLRKLKGHKIAQCESSTRARWHNTNRGVCEIVCDDAQGTRRGLSEGGVTEAKLFDQEGIAAKQVGGL